MTASNVSFLNSGNLLHTIFPRSQCWCVDGRSVFVLRVRQDSYYRIELPYDTEEDKDQITQLTSVLSQVLQYEKTKCPFTRGFEVEEAERPKTPPRKQLKKQPTQKAKKWTFDKTWVPQNGDRPSSSGFYGSDAGTVSSYEDDDRSSVCTDHSEVVPAAVKTVSRDTSLMPPPELPRTSRPGPARRLSISERVSMFQGMRSATAPIVTNRNVSAMSMERIPESPRTDEQSSEVQKPILERNVSEAASLASSADSFYSVQTTPCATPSPQYLDVEPDLHNPWEDSLSRREKSRGRSTHRRQVSEITVRAPSSKVVHQSAPVTPTMSFHQGTNKMQPSSAPSTPPLVSDSDDDSVDLPGLDVATPPDAIRMKRLTGASQKRAFSPMPQPKNLFIPSKPTTMGRQFTAALVRKTCELVLGPPSHLVSLMLRIATSISNFGFSSYRVHREEKIPCSWESDDEPEWPDEDDFGIPLNNIGDPTQRRRAFLGDLD